MNMHAVRLVLLAMLLVMGALPASSRNTAAQRASLASHHRMPLSAGSTASVPPFDVVSATGGAIGGVAISANHAYFAEGAGLTILDIGDALLPVQIGRLVLPAVAQDVQVAGNVAYMTTDKGLYVIDVSQPAAPVLIGSYATPGDAKAVRLSGARAYITVGGVYDPAIGDYAGKGLQIIDISDATHPSLLGSYQTSDFPGDVQVVGNLAYLIHGDAYNAGVQILNISDPIHITPQGNYTMPGKTGRAVKVVNGKAYIGYINNSPYSGGLQIVNVSNPSSPALLGSYTTSEGVWDVQVAGNLAFLAAYTQLVALDITTSSKPSLVSAYTISGIAETFYDGLQVANGLAYLASEASTHDQVFGIQIADVHTPAAPVARGAYRTLNPASLRIAGTFGYALNHGLVSAFDVTNPARPTFVATSAPTTTYDLDIVGNRLYNAGGTNGLQVFDFTNPHDPTLLGSYTEPGISFESVRVAGNRAYVGADFLLKIVDISNPGNLVLLGQTPSGGYPNSIEVVGTLVYVSTDVGLSIMDVSDPTHITTYAGYHPNTATRAVEVMGQRAYLAASGYTDSNGDRFNQGLYIADISDPAHPQQLGRFVTPGAALGVRLAGDRAYVTGIGEIWIVDIADPALPTLLATYDLPSQPSGMVIAGDLMYVAGGDAGLLIMRFHDSSLQSGVVGVNGGALDFGSMLALSFPPGAVTSPVTVTNHLLQQPSYGLPGDRHALYSFSLDARTSSGQLITHFEQPYTMVISYTDEQVAALGVDEADLNLAFWNGGAWVNVLPCAGCGVDTIGNRLTAVLDHFTEFALVGSIPAGDGKSRVYLPVLLR